MQIWGSIQWKRSHEGLCESTGGKKLNHLAVVPSTLVKLEHYLAIWNATKTTTKIYWISNPKCEITPWLTTQTDYWCWRVLQEVRQSSLDSLSMFCHNHTKPCLPCKKLIVFDLSQSENFCGLHHYHPTYIFNIHNILRVHIKLWGWTPFHQLTRRPGY